MFGLAAYRSRGEIWAHHFDRLVRALFREELRSVVSRPDGLNGRKDPLRLGHFGDSLEVSVHNGCRE
jgi:hypothetical protein